MNKKLKLVAIMLCLSPAVMAQQEEVDSLAQDMQTEQAFTFTEAQLEEDDGADQTITVISSNRNVYASEVGYRFSPARFRAFERVLVSSTTWSMPSAQRAPAAT